MSRQISFLLVVSLLLGAALAAGSAAVRPLTAAAAGVCDDNEYSCWMGKYADYIGQRPLNQVVQPGSHDTGTYNIQNYGSLARNQDIPVYKQLARGTRQFDIRVHSRTLDGVTDLYAYHGSVDTDVKLSTMLDDVRDFTTSPGTSKEIIYLIISSSGDRQLQTDACKRYEQSMRSIALTPSMVYSNGEMKSMDEIWALPGSPRIIFEWGACRGVSSFWNQNWSANGSYYANQGNAPCAKYAITEALYARRSATEDRNSGQDIPSSYQEGNPCFNYSNVPAGSQPMSMLGDRVTGLYTMYIQQTGLVPASALYVQQGVLDMLVDYWKRNVGSARANLNYVSADYVTDNNTSLFTKTIALNTRTDLPKITYSYDTSNGDWSQWRYVYTCTSPGDVGGAGLTAWNPGENTQAADAVRISNSSLSVPMRGKYVLRCNDNSDRRARLVQANKLATVSSANLVTTADNDQPLAPVTVRLTDAYGKPMEGHWVNFSVSGPARLTPGGQTSNGSYTDGNGEARTPVYLTHATGQVVVSASSALAPETATASVIVSPGAVTTLSATSGDGQYTSQNKTFPKPLVVTVKDRYGNPVPGRAVVFKVESGPAKIGGQVSTTVTTAADGTASTNVQSGADGGDVLVSATTGSLRTTFDLQVFVIVTGPGPTLPSADTSVDLHGPKKIKLGKTGTLRVSVLNAGPDATTSWRSLVTVGAGLKIISTSRGPASGNTVVLSGDGVAADEAVDFTVTVRAVHRGHVGYAAIANSDATDPNDQNDSGVGVLKVT